jgi:acyl-CoA synthetase (AMP-forming)/AMP-acid ligase II
MTQGPTTIPEAVALAAERWPEKLWQKFQGEELTFADLHRQVGLLMEGLAAAGVGPGTRVGLYLGNCAEWLQIELAVASLGGWLVPLNTMLAPSELRTLLAHCGCNVLVWGSEVLGHDTLGTLEEATGGGPAPRGSLPSLQVVLGLGSGSWPGWVRPWASVLEGARGTLGTEQSPVGPDDVALVIYTSGTTGRPKGVLQTHRSMNAAIARFGARLGLGPDDRSIFASPLFWIHGCWHQALMPLHRGSGLVLDTRFDALGFLETIVGEGCTHLQGVPTQYELMLAHDQSAVYDLTGLRVVQVGGSTFSPRLVDRLRARAPQARFVAAYGLSEAGVVTYTGPDDAVEDIATTVGRIHDGGEAVVLGEADEPLPFGTTGELCLRSDCVMLGYLDDPEATERALRGGWLHTGDLGVMDERGYIRILGRNQDAYKRGGVTVYAIDVETVLSEHPAVAAAAVVGVADPLLGQVGVAFVVPVPGRALDQGDLAAFCRARLAGYKVPAAFEVVADLPRTASGKVRKFELRAGYEEARAAGRH